MSKQTPQRALMNLAVAIAASEDMPLNQRHMNDAGVFIEAVFCEEPDCYLPAGHDAGPGASPCLPVLLKALADREELRDTLHSALVLIPAGAIREACEETLKTTN